MANFRNLVNDVIRQSNVLLLVLDARFVQESLNGFVESRVRESGKPLIYVINKSDLVDLDSLRKWRARLSPCVPFSAKEHLGTSVLRRQIMASSKKAGAGDSSVKVGVLGYPNVGKSSVINALKGRNSAPVSSVSGFTRGIRAVRASSGIMLLDTPGVIPIDENDYLRLVLMGSVDFSKVKEPDTVVLSMMERFPGLIERFYGCEMMGDKEEFLEMLARKKRLLKTGGVPDTVRMAKKILEDWQDGLIR